jgi:hypothetical protein
MVHRRPHLLTGLFLLAALSVFAAGPLAFAESTSMFQPVPASLRSFQLDAEGMAVTKRDGRDGPLTDASMNITASVVDENAEYSRFLAAGTIVLANQQRFDIAEAQGTIVFFKDTRGNSIAGLVNIISNHSIDESGNDLGRLRLRAVVIESNDGNSWPIAVHPSGRIGDQILLVSTEGTISSK